MALALNPNQNFTILIILVISMFFLRSEAAEGELQGQSVVKALSCFNNKHIYVGCDEAFRLNPSGNINIPVEATDFFCSGPCLTEAQLVLNCIDDILSNFLFYNKATVQQMRYALNAGCSFSRQRGNFNLAEYIGGETSNAPKSTILSKYYVFILAAVTASAAAGAVYLI
ncbi:uncharacterized protein LOC114192560 [Vigna unguiculata]|uniref:uncharacterized protein LOC114192560 n=1 Tax=Vigna unguiculata TaxID=3917 RepID=UPI00101672F4|nr:uncharacterized protein LOC114192560 [Vigna unguiculata]